RDRHPDARDLRSRTKGISGAEERGRACHKARQMEDDHSARRARHRDDRTACSWPRPPQRRRPLARRHPYGLDRRAVLPATPSASDRGRDMKVLYFAWLRERLNRGEEDVVPPADVVTVGDLIAWLRARDEAADLAMAKPELVRAALDARVVGHDA